MEAKGVDPLLHVVLSRRTEHHWVLDDVGAAEDDSETIGLLGQLDRDFLDDKVVKWLKILGSKISLILHLVDLEVKKTSIC